MVLLEGEVGAFLDAVFTRELDVAEADVGSDLGARVARGALAEVEVRIGLFTFGDIATARAVDGLISGTRGLIAALRADFGVDDFVGAWDAAGFVFVFGARPRGLTICGGLVWVRGFILPKRAAHAALEVVDEADTRLALEGARLDVLLGQFEPGEIGSVFVLGDAWVADPAVLTGSGHKTHRQYADHTKHAGQDRTGHQIVLLKAGARPCSMRSARA